MQTKTSLLISILLAAPLTAQEAPLSAIDWLAVQRNAPPVIDLAPSQPVAKSAAIPDVEVQPLDSPSVGGVGLLPTAMTGLPPSLWQGSAEDDLIRAVDAAAARGPSVPALDALLHTLLLAEAAPPNDSDGAAFLRKKLQVLYDHGLVAPAEALVERVGELTPGLFSMAFDLAVLMGNDAELCTALENRPSLSDDLMARIWCATRDGDFPHAMTIYQTGVALGQLSQLDAELALRFLDPEYGENSDPLRPPVRPTPLQFRLFEAIGEALPTTPLPLPFAVVELTGDSGWRAQLHAAERLARAGAIDGNQLLGVYTEQQPAASGGIWDRVDALQEFEATLERGEPTAVSKALEKVWPQMRVAGLLLPFSNLFASRLQDLDLGPRVGEIADKAALLSDDYERFAPKLAESGTPEIAFLAQLATGAPPQSVAADVPHATALADAWAETPQAEGDLAAMPDDNRLGEALLMAIRRFESGANGNEADITQALRTFRAFGLEDVARRAALQLAILDMEGARR